jgi:hypothetical protein
MDRAMSSWGLRGREPITRAESLQAKATHAEQLNLPIAYESLLPAAIFLYSIIY